MTRRSLLALAAAAALAGCPLPQPLPDYPAGTAITPPRILVDGILLDGATSNARAVVLVPAGCPTEPTYALTAEVFDTNTIEQVEARWFVNYAPQYELYNRADQSDTIPPDPDPLVLTRTVPPAADGVPQPFLFSPYQHLAPAGAPPLTGLPPFRDPNVVRVVELVVSNGFESGGDGVADRAAPEPHPQAVVRDAGLPLDLPDGSGDDRQLHPGG